MKSLALVLACVAGCAQSNRTTDLGVDDLAVTPDDLADASTAPDLVAVADLRRSPDLTQPDLLPGPDMTVPTYTVGGVLSGLAGTLVLSNGSDMLTLTGDGVFTFPVALGDGAPYDVQIVTQPATQTCAVQSGGSGAIAAADVASVIVVCGNTYSVGGGISGLVGTVVLTNNGGDDLPVSMDGTFTFGVRLADLAAYLVAVKTQPLGQVCAVATPGGNVAGADVTAPMVTCRKAQLALNEIHARPAIAPYGDANGDGVRDSAADEFVELMSNESSVTVDVGGWTLKSGAGPTATRFTFPAATTLAPGARLVVFGSGTPTGSFGGAQTFVAGGLALTDAPAAYSVELVGGTVIVDSFAYDATTFGSSCTKTCASVTRSPEGTGAFVAHTTVSGSPGILWSPGVAADQAIAKLSPLMSSPRAGATNVSVLAFLTMQFNMFTTPTDLNAGDLTLFASTCAAASNPVTLFTTLGPGVDASQALLIPTAPLGFGTTYCLRAGGVHSAAGVAFDASVVDYEWTTRAAASARAPSVVVSEFGGVKFGAGAGANNEFIELYNPTAADIDISGWFVQRRSAGGTATCYATIPAATTLAPGKFFLIGGVGYTAASNGNVVADLATTSTALTGGTESVLLISSAGTCTGTGSVVDAVSVEVTGAPLTDTAAVLALPPLAIAAGDGKSVERKACYDSTADTSPTGMLPTGGHDPKGNGEKIGGSNADFIPRPPNPQSTTTSPAEPYACP